MKLEERPDLVCNPNLGNDVAASRGGILGKDYKALPRIVDAKILFGQKLEGIDSSFFCRGFEC